MHKRSRYLSVKRAAISFVLCNLSIQKAKIVQITQKTQEMYNCGQFVAKSVEKHKAFLTNIYCVEGPKGPEQIH